MLDFAAKMTTRSQKLGQDDIERLRSAGFNDADILHIAFWTANFQFSNALTESLGLEPHENLNALFVDEAPGDGHPFAWPSESVVQQEAVRPGWERATVRPLEGLSLEWLNSEPLSWADVLGRVLLVFYWDVTHPNSLVGLPYWQRWHEQYAADGLVCIGVHAAEFPIARRANVARNELRRHRLRFPIALDPGYRSLAGANNRFWPSIQVIDRQGFVRFRHYGPGGYEDVEQSFRRLLDGVDAQETGPWLARPQENQYLTASGMPDLYPGYRNGNRRFGQEGRLNQVNSCAMPVRRQPGRLYVEGRWLVTDEGLELAEGTGRLAFHYYAGRFGFLASGAGSSKPIFHLRLDGEAVSPSDAGADLDDSSQVTVDGARFFWLVRHAGPEQHRAEIEVATKGARVHRISFLPFRGTGEEG